MAELLTLLWQLFSLLGLILSLRRWWRTLTDREEKRETRLLAGAILVAMVVLVAWSFAGLGVARAGGPAVHEALAAPATPPVTELVADFRDDLSLADIDRLDDRLGVEFRANSPVGRAHRLMIAPAGALTAERRRAVLTALRRDRRVEAADENLYLTAFGQAAEFRPNDPRYGEQWHFPFIGMPAAWEKSTGKGAVVAVIDTGVAFEPEGDVPAASDLKQTRCVKPYDFIRDKAKGYDDHGHGTHVAGTIAQSTNNRHGVAGIAFDAAIMPLKVLSSGGFGTVADIADAITYAADNGANVINMSLGGPRGAAVLAKACRYAHQRGVAIVCAAGNTASEGVCYPAAYPECIAVSAVGPSGELTFYSTWGKELTIAAPGGEYRSPEERGNGVLQNTVFMKQDAFEFWQGTSMASPHVAGVAALLVAQGVKGPEAIRARLKQSATPKDDPLRYGAGLLNAARAVGVKDAGLVAGLRPRPYGWLRALAGCALWPLFGVLLLYGVKPLRPWLSLGCVGFAVACFRLAAGGLAPLWLVVNGLAAVGLALVVPGGRPRR